MANAGPGWNINNVIKNNTRKKNSKNNMNQPGVEKEAGTLFAPGPSHMTASPGQMLYPIPYSHEDEKGPGQDSTASAAAMNEPLLNDLHNMSDNDINYKFIRALLDGVSPRQIARQYTNGATNVPGNSKGRYKRILKESVDRYITFLQEVNGRSIEELKRHPRTKDLFTYNQQGGKKSRRHSKKSRRLRR